jgi:hypothetical protein
MAVMAVVESIITLPHGVTPFPFGCGRRPRWEIRGSLQSAKLLRQYIFLVSLAVSFVRSEALNGSCRRSATGQERRGAMDSNYRCPGGGEVVAGENFAKLSDPSFDPLTRAQ